jgi:hypothetical protein
VLPGREDDQSTSLLRVLAQLRSVLDRGAPEAIPLLARRFTSAHQDGFAQHVDHAVRMRLRLWYQSGLFGDPPLEAQMT